MDDAERLKRGEAARRRVLGDEAMYQSKKRRNAFNADWIDWITRSPWHDVWTRPHFDDRTRRVLVIGTMISLGRWEEFRLHLEAGLGADLEWSDVEEVLLQTGVYAGLPAANTAFAIASELRGGVQGKRPTSGSA